MTDDFDDDSPFWEEPASTRTGQLPRVQPRFERSRTHRVIEKTAAIPAPVSFDDFAPEDGDAWDGVDAWVEPVEHTGRFVGVDPKLLRIGAVAMAGVLMVPLALALRDDTDEGLRSDDGGAPASVSTVAPTTAAVVTVPITAGATVASTAAPAPAARSAQPLNALAATPAPVATEPACAGTYTVIFNDFWNRFPASSGATVDEWLAANGATLDTPLYVGDELCIPAGAQPPAPPPSTTAAPVTTAAPATSAAPATTQPPATTQAPVMTLAPTPAPTTPAPPPAPPATPGSVEAIIREVWPDDLEERALTIAKRESGLRPEAHNWCCYGVFAIYFEMGKSWLDDLGVMSAEQLFDARTNIHAAYHLYTLSGWQPWSQTDPG